MDFLNEVKKNKNNMIEHMQGLLKINSVLNDTLVTDDAPFGEGVKESLEYMLNLGKEMGFKVLNVDNIAGHIEYGEGEEIIGVLVHVDVVPAVGKWKHPPFSATIENDRIYSRGAMDDKGPAISALYALKILKDMNIKLNKRVRLIIGTDEESHWRGIKRYLEKVENPTIGFSPDADFPLIYGEKGNMSIDVKTSFVDEKIFNFEAGDRYNVIPDEATVKIKDNLEIDFNKFIEDNKLKGKYIFDKINSSITMYGKAAHAMEPNRGINAAIKLCQFLSKFTDNPIVNFVADKLTDSRFNDMKLDFTDHEMGDLTVNVAVVKIDDNGGKIGLNLRYPINWDKENFIKQLVNQAKEYKLTINILSDTTPHFVDKNDHLVKTLHNAYIEYTNDTSTPIKTIGGGTYARAIKRGVAFGMTFPNREDVVHQVDEYLLIEDAVLATAIYTKAIYDLGK